MIDLLTFVAAAVVSWGLVYAIEHWARRIRLFDVPNQRSMHHRPTPRGGGAAIVIVSLLGLGVAIPLGQRPEPRELTGYLGGALFISAVSWADDIRTLPSSFRLAVHILAAMLMVGGVASGLQELTLFGQTGPGWLFLVLAIFWTIALTNAYNFMDGIDGLAATQGIVAGGAWTLLGLLTQQRWVALLALLVAAGCAGFLIRNWPPASIFMGDVGSAFLGFTFAFITLMATQRARHFVVAAPLLVWPFIFDATFTMLRRLARGENILRAHRSHLYQRLVLAGWHQAAVTSLYGLFALITCVMAAAFWIITSPYMGPAAIALVCLLSLGLWMLVVGSERRVGRRWNLPALVRR